MKYIQYLFIILLPQFALYPLHQRSTATSLSMRQKSDVTTFEYDTKLQEIFRRTRIAWLHNTQPQTSPLVHIPSVLVEHIFSYVGTCWAKTTQRQIDPQISNLFDLHHDNLIAACTENAIFVYRCYPKWEIIAKLHKWPNHMGYIWTMSLITDSIIVSSTEHQVNFWDLKTATCSKTIQNKTSCLTGFLALSPTLAVGQHEDDKIRFWNMTNQSTIKNITCRGYANTIIRLTPNTIAVTYSESPSIDIVDLDTYTISSTITLPSSIMEKAEGVYIDRCTTMPNKQLAIGISAERENTNKIIIWDIHTAQCIQTLSDSSMQTISDRIQVIKSLIYLNKDILLSLHSNHVLRTWRKLPDCGATRKR